MNTNNHGAHLLRDMLQEAGLRAYASEAAQRSDARRAEEDRLRSLQMNLARFCIQSTLGAEYAAQITDEMLVVDTMSDPGEEAPTINVDGLELRAGHFTGGHKLELVLVCHSCGQKTTRQPIANLAGLGRALSMQESFICSECDERTPRKGTSLKQTRDELRAEIGMLQKGDLLPKVVFYLAEVMAEHRQQSEFSNRQVVSYLGQLAAEARSAGDSLRDYLAPDLATLGMLDLAELEKKQYTFFFQNEGANRTGFYVFSEMGEVLAFYDKDGYFVDDAHRAFLQSEAERDQEYDDSFIVECPDEKHPSAGSALDGLDEAREGYDASGEADRPPYGNAGDHF